MNDQDIAEMNSITWWHPIKIGNQTTPGLSVIAEETFLNIGLPDDLSGFSVLDIGAWDGYYSFECEKRGAARVVASDKFVWSGKVISGNVAVGDAGFDFAHKHLDSKVEKLVASVEDLNPKKHGKFDIVLMLGVIYHAKDPIGYLEKAKAMSKGLVVVETHVDMLDVDYPAARYYVNDELNSDDTNFWGFNPAAVMGMMTDIGYKNVKASPLLFGTRMIFAGTV